MRRTFLAIIALAALAALPPTASATYADRNGRLAFTADVDGTRQVFTMKANGRQLTQVTDIDGQANLVDWSPDGRTITFTLDDCQIAFVDADGSNFRVLPPEDPERTPGEDVCDGDSSFLPDGQHVVYNHFQDEVEDFRTMRIDGTDRTLLFEACCDPNVSPDATHISFRDGDGPLFVSKLDGSERVQVSPADWLVGVKTDWSPDGGRMVFSDFRAPAPDDPVNVWTVAPDGSDPLQLTHYTDPSITAYAGSFSPDGEWIVYRVDRNDVNLHAIYRIRPDGSDAHRITPWLDWRARNIDWGPAS